MIARGGCDNTRARLLRRELRQGIARSAFLEAPGALEVLLLAEDARAGQFTERGGFHTGRAGDGAVNAEAGRDNFSQGDGGSG